MTRRCRTWRPKRKWCEALGSVPAGTYVYGLATSSAGVLKVPAGWSGAGVTTKSGFLLVSEGKVAAAEKIELGGR